MGVKKELFIEKKSKLEEAINFESRNNYLHAYQIYVSLFEQYPDDKTVCVRFANLCFKMGFYEKTILILDKITENFNSDAEVLLYAAEVYLSLQEYKKALMALDRLDAEKHNEVYILRGNAYYVLKEFDKALEQFKSYISKGENKDRLRHAYLAIAKIKIEFNERDEALQYIELAEKIVGDYWEIPFLKGTLFFKEKNFRKALRYMLKSYELDDSNDIICELIGRVYFLLNEYDKAKEFFEKAIKLGSIKSDTYSMLGLCFLYKNLIDEAKKYFEEAIKRDPDNEISKAILKKLNA